jgi:hypothetical protein
VETVDEDRLRRALRGAPVLSMVKPDAGCEARNREHVRGTGGFSDAEMLEIDELVMAIGGRLHVSTIQNRGLGRRVPRSPHRSVIYHVPAGWLDAQ